MITEKKKNLFFSIMNLLPDFYSIIYMRRPTIFEQPAGKNLSKEPDAAARPHTTGISSLAEALERMPVVSKKAACCI